MNRELRNRVRRPIQGVSPIDAAISKIEGTWFKATEVADMVGVSTSTIRRMYRRDDLRAPSKELVLGEVFVYLYSPEDVEEIKEYLNRRQK